MNETPVCLKQSGCPWECGSHSTYNNHGCRGDACRAANVAFNKQQRESRHERMMAGEISPTHGKESTYFNYLCRCTPCKVEHNRREAERRLSRNAAKADA